MQKKGAASWTAEEWRWHIGEFERLRDLESPEFLRTLERLIEDLRGDATTLYRAALRLEVKADTKVGSLKLADLGAGRIRRRLTASGYEERHLRLTNGFLDKLGDEVSMHSKPLRSQAWWLDAAAEVVVVWIEVYTDRREYLRQHGRGRAPSVGLDMFIGSTLEFKTAEIAQRLVDAKVFPERENDDDDPLAQWKQLIKRQRTRYRKRPKH